MQKQLILIILIALASCSEKDETIPPPSHPNMQYTDLESREVRTGKGQGIDIDRNGSIDFVFFVIQIGDPLFQEDKFRFLAGSNIQCNLLVDMNNASPILSKSNVIQTGNMPPYEWFEVSEVFLAEKVISVNQPLQWRGPWKDASHKYLAIQLLKNGVRYNGWIELSFDTASEKLILHKAAISTEPEKEVKAGI